MVVVFRFVVRWQQENSTVLPPQGKVRNFSSWLFFANYPRIDGLISVVFSVIIIIKIYTQLELVYQSKNYSHNKFYQRENTFGANFTSWSILHTCKVYLIENIIYYQTERVQLSRNEKSLDWILGGPTPDHSESWFILVTLGPWWSLQLIFTF